MTERPVGDRSAESRPDLVDLLRDLAGLRDDGLLTEVEFQRARSLAVAGRKPVATPQPPAR